MNNTCSPPTVPILDFIVCTVVIMQERAHTHKSTFLTSSYKHCNDNDANMQYARNKQYLKDHDDDNNIQHHHISFIPPNVRM